MYFALTYETVENFVERRQPYRVEHLAMAKEAHRTGMLVLAGALKPSGALLVFKTDRMADVEAFAKNDPYVKNELVSRWTVREWTVVIGNE